MGISSLDLDALLFLKENGYIPDHAAVIEIGAQQLSNSLLQQRNKVEKLGRLFGVTESFSLLTPSNSRLGPGGRELLTSEAPFARYFWQWLGLYYASIDIDGSPGSIPLDLNYDHTPPESLRRYNLVTNFGTTEHIANQLNAFKVIHELAAVGGVMLHSLPVQGNVNHGLINYNLKFFWMLARSNGYKWLDVDYIGTSTTHQLPRDVIESVSAFRSDFPLRAAEYRVSDADVVIAFEKIFDIPFVPPLDVNTGSKTDNKVLEARYWSVYKPGAFDALRGSVTPSGFAQPAKGHVGNWLGRVCRWFASSSQGANESISQAEAVSDGRAVSRGEPVTEVAATLAGEERT
jgi:hypothetical protein